MVNIARNIGAFGALLLGLGHIGVGLKLYSELTLDVLWFHAAGVAMICVALTNLGAVRITNTQKFSMAIQNAMMVIFFAIVWRIFPAPQVAIGGALFLLLFVTGVGARAAL